MKPKYSPLHLKTGVIGISASSSEITAWQALSEPNSCPLQRVASAPDYPVHQRDLVGPRISAASVARPFGIKLKIEIQEKLEWDWSQVHWRQLAFSFVVEPGFNKIRGKDIALEQPVMIRLQCVEHFT